MPKSPRGDMSLAIPHSYAIVTPLNLDLEISTRGGARPLDDPPLDEPPLDDPPMDEPPLDEPPLDEPPLGVGVVGLGILINIFYDRNISKNDCFFLMNYL